MIISYINAKRHIKTRKSNFDAPLLVLEVIEYK